MTGAGIQNFLIYSRLGQRPSFQWSVLTPWHHSAVSRHHRISLGCYIYPPCFFSTITNIHYTMYNHWNNCSITWRISPFLWAPKLYEFISLFFTHSPLCFNQLQLHVGFTFWSLWMLTLMCNPNDEYLLNRSWPSKTKTINTILSHICTLITQKNT